MSTDTESLTAALSESFRKYASPEFLSVRMCEVCGHKPAETLLLGSHTDVCVDCFQDAMAPIYR